MTKNKTSVIDAVNYVKGLPRKEREDYEKVCKTLVDEVVKNPTFVEHYSKVISETSKSLSLRYLSSQDFESLNSKAFLLLYNLCGPKERDQLFNSAWCRKDDERYSLIIKKVFLEQYEKAKNTKCKRDIAYVMNFFENLDSTVFNSYLDNFSLELSGRGFKKRLFPDLVEEDLTSIYEALVEAVRYKKPFSLIRLGDGEGGFLTSSDSMAKKDQEDIVKIWFGDFCLSDDTREKFCTFIAESVASCDIVGIPSLHRLVQDFRPSNNNRNFRSIKRLYETVSMLGDDDKIVTSAFVHADVYQSGVLSAILQEAGEVSIISGHGEELSNRIKREYQCNVRRFIRVPTEEKFRKRFGYDEPDAPHFPDRYNEIMELLRGDELTGQVFLVGAGFLGKKYCHEIKVKGGIAIDIGSVFDYIMGYRTRRF